MRTWRETLRSLTKEPRGYVADGRTLGLGLATAMAKTRQDPTLHVEQYLRRQASQQRRTTVA